jgi:phage shock protein PspC (stress-responsive transcriptional regulator)
MEYNQEPASGQGHPLRRPLDDRVLAGVCAAFARSLGIDPTLVRLGWLVLTLLGGSGLALYLLAAAVIPDDMGQRSQLALLLFVLIIGLPLLCSLCALPLGIMGSLANN